MMQSNESRLAIFALPDEVQEHIASYLDLRDACALRLTSRAALASSLWWSEPWWPAVFALVGGAVDKFMAVIPACAARFKVAFGSKECHKEALFTELACALVRANVGDDAQWTTLRNWAGDELPINAANHFAIIRAGLHAEPYEEEEEEDYYKREESPTEPARREPPPPPESKHAIAALSAVLQWKDRKGDLLYAAYAEQTMTTPTSQLPPIAPVLASPLIPSPVRRDLLRAHCSAKFYDEEPGELVPAMLLEGPLFCLEILCLSARRLIGNSSALSLRVESFLEKLIAHTFGSEEHFETMQIVHDILIAASDQDLQFFGPTMNCPVHLGERNDTEVARQRLYARIEEVRRDQLPAGQDDDGEDNASLPDTTHVHKVLTGASRIEYKSMFSRASLYALMYHAPRTSEAIRAWANALRYWEPIPSLWVIIVTMLRNTRVHEVADEAEELLPATHDGEAIMFMFRIGSEMVLRSRPFESVVELREAYEAAARVPRRGGFF
ncbi:hypothetical protein H9P43_001826 [Blastocladiella emersonii ATCC 22665]|nr:hypothetical protein H9P43_001826 [Blastocladiella emersonii ATCC 22665]